MKLFRLAALAPVLAMGLALARPAAAEAPRTDPALLLGTAWYPEAWPEARWEADLALMERAHVRFVRIAEFAWSTMEPREGDYRFEWLERAVRAAERHHIAVVLGTPTAAPPAWLTTAYPETLRVLRDGRRAEHGGRQQFDWSSPKYRELARDIASRMAERFGRDRNVIGWQIDNEYGEVSVGPPTRAQFQAWLKARYGTLDALNTRWATAYWSQTYTDWAQIPVAPERGGNPGLMLAWKGFVSDTWRDYQEVQLDAIRAKAEPRQKITTNIISRQLDYHEVTQDLDWASWDLYYGSSHAQPIADGLNLDMIRGLKRQNFWIMETQPGHVNWAGVNVSLDKGETRAVAWRAVGHGADAVAYWQWRSAPNGQEQYHGVMVGADGQPVPVYEEIAQLGADFAKAGPALAGTTVKAEVAVIHDYSSRWAVEWQAFHKDFEVPKAMEAAYTPLQSLTRAVDVVAATAPMSAYKLVVAPALQVITDAQAMTLADYVRGGGHLVLTARSGMKDGDNALWPQDQPGPLADLLGAHVSQWYALEAPVVVDGPMGAGSARIWAELIKPTAPDVEVLARYAPSNGFLDGQPAAVTRRVGKGRITYLGADLDPAGMSAFTAWMARTSGVAAVLPDLAEGVDAVVRTGSGRRVIVLTNFAKEARDVRLPSPVHDVLAGGPATATVSLPRYGVAVLEAAERP